MRRKSGALVPLETSILLAAVDLDAAGISQFHGYQIARHLADTAERRQLTAYGTLYRALARLEAMGLVESQWENPEAAAAQRRPVRRLYTVTAGGQQLAHAQQREAPRARLLKTPRKGVAPA